MLGYIALGDTAEPAKIENWLGRNLNVVGSTVTTIGYIAPQPYTTVSGKYPLLEAAFPLLSIFGENNKLDDMAKAANGDYDSTYASMAAALAAWKNPLMSVRIGWEFNGNWYPWSAGVGKNATTANYIAAFRRAAIQLRAKNPKVLIQWCIAWGQPDPTPYWPGAYNAASNPGGVDVVSVDFYQANISTYNNGGKQSTWAMAQSGATGQKGAQVNLDWVVDFAQKQGLRMALSEYAAGQSNSGGSGSGHGLDDGTWTADSIRWMNSQARGFFLWSDWSKYEPADDIVTQGANPNEQKAWTDAWKNTTFGGTWWSGTPPP